MNMFTTDHINIHVRTYKLWGFLLTLIRVIRTTYTFLIRCCLTPNSVTTKIHYNKSMSFNFTHWIIFIILR